MPPEPNDVFRLGLTCEQASAEIIRFYESYGGARCWPALRSTRAGGDMPRLVLGGDGEYAPAYIDIVECGTGCEVTITSSADRSAGLRLDDTVRGRLDGRFGLGREPDPDCVEFCQLLREHLRQIADAAVAAVPAPRRARLTERADWPAKLARVAEVERLVLKRRTTLDAACELVGISRRSYHRWRAKRDT